MTKPALGVLCLGLGALMQVALTGAASVWYSRVYLPRIAGVN